MEDERKTKKQLINELVEMRQRIAELKKREAERKRAEEELKVLDARVAGLERGVLGDARFDNATPAHISPPSKPEIPDETLAKWQRIVDLMARIVGVAAGLIMKIDPPQIEVFVASATEGNPYEKGERADLGTGLYCETVMAQRSPLLVPDALKDPNWDHNPDIELGMVFYLGFPLMWPDGEIFGTICVLDSRENQQAVAYQELLAEFKEIIEMHLMSLVVITERERAEETIKHMAYHDPLTGLPNRRLFNDRLNLALAHAHRNQKKLAVMLLDLDQFKEVNDTLGHSVGDQLLQVVSERLTDLLRKDDTVARMGGDEFMLLLPEIAGGEGAAKVAQKVLEALREPFVLDSHELRITTSIGMVFYPDDGEDADTLVKNADIAMYRAKDQGRDNCQRWQPMTQEQQP